RHPAPRPPRATPSRTRDPLGRRRRPRRTAAAPAPRPERPRHQLRVEAQPVGRELVPQAGSLDSAPHRSEQRRLEWRLEEAAARPRPAGADTFAGDTEAPAWPPTRSIT